MINEILLILSVFLIFGGAVILYGLFDEVGLYGFTVLATITANIEVLMMVKAFGMEQTLGNILFASTFLVTDILSEVKGKKEAQKAVYIGIAVSVLFILITMTWMYYIPSSQDWATPAIHTIFSNTPRMMIVGIVTYAIVQQFDVWAYHKWWALTERLSGNHGKYLWIRNNGSTLISQLLNTLLFTWGAFLGTYDTATLISIALSSYVIFVVTSVVDTPFVYLARWMDQTKRKKV